MGIVILIEFDLKSGRHRDPGISLLLKELVESIGGVSFR